MLPADHVIRDVPAFQQAVAARPRRAREQGKLVTFGIVPSAPETGYGYIQRGAAQRRGGYRIARVRREAGRDAARSEFVTSGDYYWNSGMFLFRARRYLEELERFAPEIAAVCASSFAGAHARSGFHAHRCDGASRPVRSDSIDYAVMEKTADAVVVPLDAGWSDVGSWASLHAACDARCAAATSLDGDVIGEDTHGCYLYAESRLVAAVGSRRTTWWWRPRMRCWSRPRIACRT